MFNQIINGITNQKIFKESRKAISEKQNIFILKASVNKEAFLLSELVINKFSEDYIITQYLSIICC